MARPTGTTKTETIVKLRQQLKDNDAQWRITCKERIKRAVISNNARHARANKNWKRVYKAYSAKRYQRFIVRMNKRIRERSEIRAVEKLDTLRINRAKYMDGIFAYSIINAWARAVNITPTELAYLILLNIVGKLTTRDCVKFGFSERSASHDKLTQLADLELAERFNKSGGKRLTVFVPSLLGEKVFTGFKEYYAQMVKKQIGSNAYKKRAHDWAK